MNCLYANISNLSPTLRLAYTNDEGTKRETSLLRGFGGVPQYYLRGWDGGKINAGGQRMRAADVASVSPTPHAPHHPGHGTPCPYGFHRIISPPWANIVLTPLDTNIIYRLFTIAVLL